jgi:hypothetical protein
MEINGRPRAYNQDHIQILTKKKKNEITEKLPDDKLSNINNIKFEIIEKECFETFKKRNINFKIFKN